MQVKGQSYGTGVGFVLLATLGWSLSGIFVRFMPTLDGWQINTWRGYWMAVTLLCYLVFVYGHETWAKFKAVPLGALLISTFFFTLGSTLYVTSLTMVGTAVIAMIGATSPIFTGLASRWVTGERAGPTAILAALMALAGMAVIAWDGLENGKLIGIIVCIGVPICFAGQTLLLRKYRNVDMVPAICVGGITTFFVAGFGGFLAGHTAGGFDVSLRDAGLLALMGAVQLAAPLIFYAWGARSVNAVTLSLLAMLDAVLNPLWPWLFVNEVPSKSSFIGGGVIVVAVLISIFGPRFFEKENQPGT